MYNTQNISAKNNFSNTINDTLIKNNEKFKKLPETLIKYFKNKTLKYNLDKRIFYYNHIVNRLKNINTKQCLKEYSINSSKKDDVKGYSISDIVFLTKKFGSISKYGYIYESIRPTIFE